MPPVAAFEKTVEQMLLKVLKDFDPKTSLGNMGYHRQLTLLIGAMPPVPPGTLSLNDYASPVPVFASLRQSGRHD